MKAFAYIMTSFFLCLGLSAQKSAYQLDWQEQIDFEQNRIDIVDGDLDGIVMVGNIKQSELATKIYLTRIDKLQETILTFEKFSADKYARGLFEYLKKVQKNEINHLSSSLRNIELLEKILTLNDEAKELELLKTDLKTGLNISDIINLKPYAKTYWIYAAGFYPTDVLNAFKNLAYTPLGNDVLLALARIAPGAIKQYFGSNHLIDRAIKNSKDSIAILLYDIYRQY